MVFNLIVKENVKIINDCTIIWVVNGNKLTSGIGESNSLEIGNIKNRVKRNKGYDFLPHRGEPMLKSKLFTIVEEISLKERK